jgi:hypothetical protein
MPFDGEFALDIEEEFQIIAPQMRELRPLASDERHDGEVSVISRAAAPVRSGPESPDQ